MSAWDTLRLIGRAIGGRLRAAYRSSYERGRLAAERQQARRGRGG